jgi:hypothetical protein
MLAAFFVLFWPVMAAGQAAGQVATVDSTIVINPADPWWLQLMKVLVVPIVGLLTKYGWDGVEKIMAYVADPNKINPTLKPFLVVVFGFVIATVASKLAIALPGDFAQWTPATLTKIIGAIFGILIHIASKRAAEKKAAAAAGVPTPA